MKADTYLKLKSNFNILLPEMDYHTTVRTLVPFDDITVIRLPSFFQWQSLSFKEREMISKTVSGNAKMKGLFFDSGQKKTC